MIVAGESNRLRACGITEVVVSYSSIVLSIEILDSVAVVLSQESGKGRSDHETIDHRRAYQTSRHRR